MESQYNHMRNTQLRQAELMGDVAWSLGHLEKMMEVTTSALPVMSWGLLKPNLSWQFQWCLRRNRKLSKIIHQDLLENCQTGGELKTKASALLWSAKWMVSQSLILNGIKGYALIIYEYLPTLICS